MKLQPFLLLAALFPLLCGCGSKSFGIVSVAIANAPFGQTYRYQIAVEHPEGALTFFLDTAPLGMTLSPDGLLEWTPQYADLGMHPVALRVSDGVSILGQAFNLRIHQNVNLGTTVSWRGWVNSGTAQDVYDFYALHAPHGRVIALHTSWRDDLSSAGQIPSDAMVHMQAIQQLGGVPMVGFGWTDGDGNPDLLSDGDPVDNSWSNLETRAEFKAMVVQFAQTYRPPYLFLGNETNIYRFAAGVTQQDWDEWLSMFEECYQLIKGVSPNTMVFVTFQLEAMQGVGVHNGWSYSPHFSLLGDYAHLDAAAFTSFPYFEYDDPAMIPADYYDEITMWWTGPVMFTEIGWPGTLSPPYPGGLIPQEDFIPRFFELTDDLPLEFVDYIFLHDVDDQTGLDAFKDIGLRNNQGTLIRPADGEWQAAVSLRQR